MSDEWQSPTFRQSVVAKINEAMLSSSMNTNRNANEMENHVFQKARTREEYLSFLAKLILHVRDSKNKNAQQQQQQQHQQQQQQQQQQHQQQQHQQQQQQQQQHHQQQQQLHQQQNPGDMNNIPGSAGGGGNNNSSGGLVGAGGNIAPGGGGGVGGNNNNSNNSNNNGNANNSGTGMLDPINALQNLASQGSRTPMPSQMLAMGGGGGSGSNNVSGIPIGGMPMGSMGGPAGPGPGQPSGNNMNNSNVLHNLIQRGGQQQQMQNLNNMQNIRGVVGQPGVVGMQQQSMQPGCNIQNIIMQPGMQGGGGNNNNNMQQQSAGNMILNPNNNNNNNNIMSVGGGVGGGGGAGGNNSNMNMNTMGGVGGGGGVVNNVGGMGVNVSVSGGHVMQQQNNSVTGINLPGAGNNNNNNNIPGGNINIGIPNSNSNTGMSNNQLSTGQMPSLQMQNQTMNSMVGNMTPLSMNAGGGGGGGGVGVGSGGVGPGVMIGQNQIPVSMQSQMNANQMGVGPAMVGNANQNVMAGHRMAIGGGGVGGGSSVTGGGNIGNMGTNQMMVPINPNLLQMNSNASGNIIGTGPSSGPGPTGIIGQGVGVIGSGGTVGIGQGPGNTVGSGSGVGPAGNTGVIGNNVGNVVSGNLTGGGGGGVGGVTPQQQMQQNMINAQGQMSINQGSNQLGHLNQMLNVSHVVGGIGVGGGGGGGGGVGTAVPGGRKQQQQQPPPGGTGQDLLATGMYPQVRNIGPQQQYFNNKSPSPSVPSPANINSGSGNMQTVIGGPHQMVGSPSMPAPSPQMPSTIITNTTQQSQQHQLTSQSQQQQQQQQQQNPPSVPSTRNVMAPSPSSTSLNTPGQAVAAPSPLNPAEEQMYREKYRQLTKYIDPLKRMVARIGSDDEKLLKMNKLLELLCNPSKRIPLETLLKCEVALERMDFKSNIFGSSGGPPTTKEQQANNTLLEAVSANLQSPIGNHTLQRTFRPTTEAFFGPTIKNLPPPSKRMRSSIISSAIIDSDGIIPLQQQQQQQSHLMHHLQPHQQSQQQSQHHHHHQNIPQNSHLYSSSYRFSSRHSSTVIPYMANNGGDTMEISHILQGEIARLDTKFKINLDPATPQSGMKIIKLICCLDDRHLPCVPPITITIPDDYPWASPTCNLINEEYNTTPFLITVQDALNDQIAQLPSLFSLSHLLDTWEMAVRQSCSPTPIDKRKLICFKLDTLL